MDWSNIFGVDNYILHLEYNILQLPKPDLTLFLDLSIETSQQLMDSRDDKVYIMSWKKDIHENDLDHLKNAQNVVNQVVEMQENFVKIDCEEAGELLSREKVLENILVHIKH